MNSVKDKLKLEIPEDPDIDKDPKEYIRVYGFHSLIKRLWDVDRTYEDNGIVKFNSMRHHIVITYSIRKCIADGREIDLDKEDLDCIGQPKKLFVKSEIHTEIVPNAKKFYNIVNRFYDKYDHTRSGELFAKLVKEGFLTREPSEVLAITDIEWDKKASIKDDLQNIVGSYGYSYIDEKEIRALNEILDNAEMFSANAKAQGREFITEINWVNHYRHIDHGAIKSIYGPFYVQPESVLKAMKSKERGNSGLFGFVKKLFGRK